LFLNPKLLHFRTFHQHSSKPKVVHGMKHQLDMQGSHKSGVPLAVWANTDVSSRICHQKSKGWVTLCVNKRVQIASHQQG
jgi:hypothetical protein